MAASTASTSLTSYEREIIASARGFCEAKDMPALSALTGMANPDLVYPIAFGNAVFLMRELSAIVERLAAE